MRAREEPTREGGERRPVETAGLRVVDRSKALRAEDVEIDVEPPRPAAAEGGVATSPATASGACVIASGRTTRTTPSIDSTSASASSSASRAPRMITSLGLDDRDGPSQFGREARRIPADQPAELHVGRPRPSVECSGGQASSWPSTNNIRGAVPPEATAPRHLRCSR
jgi:hypothetical protein